MKEKNINHEYTKHIRTINKENDHNNQVSLKAKFPDNVSFYNFCKPLNNTLE